MTWHEAFPGGSHRCADYQALTCPQFILTELVFLDAESIFIPIHDHFANVIATTDKF